MKDGVVVVNTARGAVIDEAALVQALDSGKVFSAGLDVFEDEPKIHPGLVRNPNAILVPHMGTWTVEVSRVIPVPLPGWEDERLIRLLDPNCHGGVGN